MAKQTYPYKAIDSQPAGTNYKSEAMDVSNHPWASFQVICSGLTGTLDGTLSLETTCVPNPSDSDWVQKSDANGNPVSVTLDSAGKSELYSLNGVVGEPKARLVFTKNGLTGGTINAWFNAKSGGR